MTPKRDLNKFLEDQQRFEDMKRQKVNELAEEVHKQQLSQTLRQPYINQKSLQYLEKREVRKNSIARGDSQKRPPRHQTDSKLSTGSMQQPFQPNISTKSRQMSRDRKVEDILYDDA